MIIQTYARKYAIFVILIALFILFSIFAPAFMTLTNIMNIARQISMMGIVTVGMTFIMLTGGVDLSVGSQMSCINITTAWLLVYGQVSVPIAIIGGIMTGVIWGIFNGFIVIKSGIPSLIVTLATMQIIKGITLIICGGLPIFGFPAEFAVLGQGYIGPFPIPVIIFIFVLAIGSFLLNKVYIGRYFYAVGGNSEAAELSGINNKRIQFLVFVLCGFLTGLASVIMLSRVNSGQAVTGSGLEFDVLTAAILGGVSLNGGKGGISSVIVGSLIMGILNNGLTLMDVNQYFQYVVKGATLLLAMWYDVGQKRTKNKYSLRTNNL